MGLHPHPLHSSLSLKKRPSFSFVDSLENLQDTITRLESKEIRADINTYASLLRFSARTQGISLANRLHRLIQEANYGDNQYLGSLLLNVYVSCETIAETESLFEEMKCPNAHSWSLMIKAYASSSFDDENGKARSWFFFDKMVCEGIMPKKVTFAYALSTCSDPRDIAKGKQLHALILHNGFGTCFRIATCLVTMYAKCGNLSESRDVFESMVERDLICWNALISSYGQHGYEHEALQVFYRMQWEEDTQDPNRSTFVSILDACASITSLSNGKLIHHYVVSSGLELDIVISTAVSNMYGKCGDLVDSLHVFYRTPERDVILWNSMVAVLIQHECYDDALQCTTQMQKEGLMANQATIVSILDACANLELGKRIHSCSISLNLEVGIEVGSALVNMYGKCSDVQEAEKVFVRLHRRDVLAWTAMITVYAQNGRYKMALQIFELMQKEQVIPDRVSFLSILPAYASQAAINEGQHMHTILCNIGLELDPEIANALITMYGKCGSLESAEDVFEKMQYRDVVSWNAIIAAYAQHGNGKKVLWLSDQMRTCVRPDCVTYISIFLACSHSGLLEEGRRCLASMTRENGIELTPQHYNCLIDLLARAGRLDEAENMLKSLGFEPTYAQWVSLLGACRNQSDVERGERAATHALTLDPTNRSPSLMLSHIYAQADKDSDLEMLSSMQAS